MRDAQETEQHEHRRDRKAGGGNRTMHLAASDEVLRAVACIAGEERQRQPIAPVFSMPISVSLDGGNDDRERDEEQGSQCANYFDASP